MAEKIQHSFAWAAKLDAFWRTDERLREALDLDRGDGGSEDGEKRSIRERLDDVLNKPREGLEVEDEPKKEREVENKREIEREVDRGRGHSL